MKHKILFILPSLAGGGAEKVVLTILTYINRDKFSPVLVLLKKEGKFLDQVPKDIQVIDLDSKRARYAIFKIFKTIKELKPDIVFSTLGHLNLLMAIMKILFLKKIKFIARESNTVSLENKQEKYPFIFNFLYKTIYNNFDLIIAQSKYMRDDLVDNFSIKKSKISVIYNPVDIKKIDKMANSNDDFKLPKDKINLLSVGRLSYQKGFDMLIQTISLLDIKYHLTILGEGDDEKKLKQLIIKYQLKDRVTLAGFSDNPYIYMKNCDLLILSSRYEGLPNVVLESHACGTPCVAINNPGGTSEIIEEEKNGLLSEKFDYDLLAEKIKKATDIKFDKEYIKQHCKKNYSVDKIIKEYESKLTSL